ncbi:MAG: response regulator transcription factor [Candidatus Obscuribacterales bacterium]|nr:response regulator transcription factor [Candidatus Obscuribacterales bacterium]
MYNVLIVDDLPALRKHASDLLREIDPQVKITEAASGKECLEVWPQLKPDMIIMDIVMPDLNGIKAAKEIWSRELNQKILFWSQFHRESFVRELGKIVPDEAIHGYALKSESDDKLKYALESILCHDNPYIDPIVRGVQKTIEKTWGDITDSEYYILLDLALGLTDRAIAMRHHISVRGAQNRIYSLSIKLVKGVDAHLKETAGLEVYNTRVRIVLEAFRLGIIAPEDIQELDGVMDSWLDKQFHFKKDSLQLG